MVKGPVCNLFVIGVHMSQSARTNPAQCTIIMGDLNVQLPSDIPELTGKWAYGKQSSTAQPVIDLMRIYIQPRSGKCPISTKKESIDNNLCTNTSVQAVQ